MLTNVTIPSITICRPAKDKTDRDRDADLPRGRVLEPRLATGGRGGRGLAELVGVTGIILKYRVPRGPMNLRACRPAPAPGRSACGQPGPQSRQRVSGSTRSGSA